MDRTLVIEGRFSSTDVDGEYELVWIEDDEGEDHALGNAIEAMVVENLRAAAPLPPTAAGLLSGGPSKAARVKVTVEYLGEQNDH